MKKNSIHLFAILIFIGLLWQSIVWLFQLPDYILPSPITVLITLFVQRKIILAHLGITFLETLLGLCLGITLGFLASVVIARFRSLKNWFLPLLVMSQAIPTFAIAPLFVIWLGYGLSSKIAITVMMIFFPVMSNCYDGLMRTPRGWLDLAQSLEATPWRTFFYIRLPAALPTFASGIRIAAVSAPIGAIVGEWVGASQGLGYLMLNANARLQIDVMFAVLIVIMIYAWLLYASVDKLLRTIIWWQP